MLGTRKFTAMLAATSVVFFMCVTVVPASASVETLVDQQQTTGWQGNWGNIPMGQTFTPSVNNIVGFDINVSMYGTTGTYTFEVWKWSDRSVLVGMPAVTGSGTIHVDLSEPVMLVPGDKYAIMVTAASPSTDIGMTVDINHSISGGDPYTGGAWVFQGSENSFYDAWFKTYYDPMLADTTPPTITITTPAESADYMLNEVVLADYGCTDAGSGVASCEAFIGYGNESIPVADGEPLDTSRLSTVIGPNATFVVVAYDVAGNYTSAHVHYNVVDPEPFTGRFGVNISTGEDGQDQYVTGWGWKHGPVTIYLGDGWGNPIGTAPLVEGGFFSMVDPGTFAPGDTVKVMDAVGNHKSLLVANLAVGSVDGPSGWVAGTCDVGTDVDLEYSTDDAHPTPTQLVAPCIEGMFEDYFSPDELPNYPEGSYVEARQWDADGDGTQVDAWYPQYQTFSYDWTGFLRPVDNTPTLNTVKAGQAIPVKFSLGGDQGLSIFAEGYPKVLSASCSLDGGLDAIEVTVTAGGSSLSYDPLTDTYTYVWKTNKAWGGTCRQLDLTLADGTSHLANFKFTK